MRITNNLLPQNEQSQPSATGWLPPMPDLRDYTADNLHIKAITEKLGMDDPKNSESGPVDLRQWFSPVENQGNIGSCTAHAGIGIVEYFEKRASGRHSEGSRLFLYKTTRNLMQVTGDAGGWLRSTMGAIVLCGIPAEKYWPYITTGFDKEPDAFVYSLANNYKAVKYFCHDPAGSKIPFTKVLTSVKQYLEAGIPSMFGFWGFPSFDKSDTKGGIPYPASGEKAEWGHAVVAAGYDDSVKIRNLTNDQETTGALLIRNSWGKEWGDKGYGWLPYEYILNGLALDFWSLISMEWVETGQFGV